MISVYAVLRAIRLHCGKVLLTFDYALFDTVDYVGHGDYRIHFYAEVAQNFLHGRKIGIETLFHTVDGYYHAGNLYVCRLFEFWQDLAQGLARRHDVFDDEHLFPVNKLFAHKEPAFAVVLYLLAVEAVIYVYAVVVPKGHRGRDRKGNALVCRPHKTIGFHLVFGDACRVIFA